MLTLADLCRSHLKELGWLTPNERNEIGCRAVLTTLGHKLAHVYLAQVEPGDPKSGYQLSGHFLCRGQNILEPITRKMAAHVDSSEVRAHLTLFTRYALEAIENSPIGIRTFR